MEIESRLDNCNNCPEVKGRSCIRYKAGRARLVFTPKETPTGIKLGEPYSVNESIEDCPFRPRENKNNDIKVVVAS